MHGRPEAEDPKLKQGRILRRHIFSRENFVSIVIWMLLASIFMLDMLTKPDNISVGFAYAIPIFVSLFERRPHPFLYAGIATVLSLSGSIIQPPGDISIMVILANRVIAVLTQWLAAFLVATQQQRVIDIEDEAERQRRFVDILSHEIGTALTTVTGQAYRLTKLSEQLAPSDLRLRVAKIQTAAERIETIVNRIQFASSLDSSGIPIVHGSINLHDLIQQVTEQLREEQGTRPIELNLCSEPQVVSGDETLLRQVFENIIKNSVKYSAQDAPIAVSLAKHGAASRIKISDRGIGIPQHELLRVREPYYRGESSKGISGAGLGLYIAERIVEAHKGRFIIKSESGKGTQVIIDLPQIAEGVAT